LKKGKKPSGALVERLCPFLGVPCFEFFWSGKKKERKAINNIE